MRDSNKINIRTEDNIMAFCVVFGTFLIICGIAVIKENIWLGTLMLIFGSAMMSAIGSIY